MIEMKGNELVKHIHSSARMVKNVLIGAAFGKPEGRIQFASGAEKTVPFCRHGKPVGMVEDIEFKCSDCELQQEIYGLRHV